MTNLESSAGEADSRLRASQSEVQDTLTKALELSEKLQNDGLVTVGGSLANLVQESSKKDIQERSEAFARTLKRALNEQVQLYGSQQSILMLSTSSYAQVRKGRDASERARRAKLYLDAYLQLLTAREGLEGSLQAASAAQAYLASREAISGVELVAKATSYARVYIETTEPFEQVILEDTALTSAQLEEYAGINELFAARYREAKECESSKKKAFVARVKASLGRR